MIIMVCGVADFAALDGALDARVVGVKTAVEADLQLHAALGDSSQRRVNLRQVEGDGLLAEDLLCRPAPPR